jgi:hypothetical protein
MTPTFKKYGLLIFGTILPITLLVIVWFVNGAEMEDAWLYLASIGVVLSSTVGAYSQNKKND